MYEDLRSLLQTAEDVTLVLSDGFERRTLRGVEVLRGIGFRPARVVVLRYRRPENEKSYANIAPIAQQLVTDAGCYAEVDCSDVGRIDALMADVDRERGRIVCDVSGLSRYMILALLTRVYKKGLRFGCATNL
jgi:hypothetical protein